MKIRGKTPGGFIRGRPGGYGKERRIHNGLAGRGFPETPGMPVSGGRNPFDGGNRHVVLDGLALEECAKLPGEGIRALLGSQAGLP